MNNHPCYASDEHEFLEVRREVSKFIRLGTELPAWPFQADSGFATVYEYDRLLGGDFGEVLEALVSVFDDEKVFVLGIEPSWEYYKREYNYFAGFSLRGESVSDDYCSAIRWEPGGDATGSLGFTADSIGIVGSSGQWSLLGQRDWEIAVLLAERQEGPWLNCDIPGWAGFFDLSDIRSPPGWGMPLSDTDLETFWRNISRRGSGPSD
ncbi:hypothetical protein [Sanguibacter suaedae]|uniref:Uncharacterized protein n=1 Tax=Sanguibacter suaedae TaxID=2795737 RepID=A0A934I2K8_9MICO|nr:hypothetical protein [Sanguibacter suaedae]MBI9114424.1 hypothetical protein [Sanguibacter suaedae]